jgi:hypothetical protein
MRKPRRIQRKRTKGWRMPEGAVYVGRPTKWGNPYVLTSDNSLGEIVRQYRELVSVKNIWSTPNKQQIKDELRGKDLVCWCPLNRPCHADVLLEIANK